MVMHEARGKARFCLLEAPFLAIDVSVAFVVAAHLRGDAFARAASGA